MDGSLKCTSLYTRCEGRGSVLHYLPSNAATCDRTLGGTAAEIDIDDAHGLECNEGLGSAQIKARSF
jgi:hypothetical protein